MKYILGCIRKCDEEFNLIKDGDNIAVGVSGGKDSILLLYALHLYRNFSKSKFNIKAVTVDLNKDNPFNAEPIKKLCDEIGVEYQVIPTNITRIVFEERKEKNPCSLCSTMRRGAIHKWCKQNNCNKIALGHHREDALHTFLMSLLFEGRMSTLSPITWMNRADIEQIRPMLFIPEKEIISQVKKLGLPVTKSKCIAEGNTNRDEMKKLIEDFKKLLPDADKNMLLALRKIHNYNLWDNNKKRLEDMPAWHVKE